MPRCAGLGEGAHDAGMMQDASMVLAGADLGGVGRVDQGGIEGDIFGMCCRAIFEREGD